MEIGEGKEHRAPGTTVSVCAVCTKEAVVGTSHCALVTPVLVFFGVVSDCQAEVWTLLRSYK